MIEANIVKYFEPGWEVWRFTPVPDGWGGTVKEWLFHIEVEGRLRPLDIASATVRLSADRETVFADYKFYCFLADIREGDQLRRNGQVYDVKSTPDMMDFGRLMQIGCKRVE